MIFGTVILYRLLTGVLPIDLQKFRANAQMAAMEAMRSKICDEDPQKPSARIGTGDTRQLLTLLRTSTATLTTSLSWRALRAGDIDSRSL